MTRKSNSTKRSKNGTALAEFGPALWILAIGFFFPCLNLISIGVTYGSGFTLNNLQAQQAAYSKYSEVAANTKAVEEQWKGMGLGRFCNLENEPKTTVSLVKGQDT